MDIYNLVSFSGIFILIGFAWIVSRDRKNMNWRVIIWGVSLQILIAIFIFVVPVGSKLFLVLNDVVIKVLDSSSAGAKRYRIFAQRMPLSFERYPRSIINKTSRRFSQICLNAYDFDIIVGLEGLVA